MRDHQQSRILNELCALALALIRSTPLTVADDNQRASNQPGCLSPPTSLQLKASPTEIASLMMGVSLTLMLCGWVTFFIGFFLMPWVIGAVTVLYLVGFVSNLSGLWRNILFSHLNSSVYDSPSVDVPAFGYRVACWKE